MLNSEQILAVLWKRRVTVLLTFALTLAAIAVVTFSLPKVYSTTSYVLVNSKAGGSAFEATQVNQVALKTYSELLQTRNVANLVAKDLPGECRETAVALQGGVAVQAVAQSQLLEITAEGKSPACAQTVANTYAQSFIAHISQLAGKTATTTTVSLAEPAALISAPVRPKPKLYLIIGALLALAAGAGMALLRQRLDQRLEIDETTTEVLGLPVIGRIPEPPGKRMRTLLRSEGDGEDTRGLDEAFRLVLANLSFVNLGQRPASIAVVSAGPGEGKTTCCESLGRAANENGLDVALVDGDLRNPSLTERLDPSRRGAGLSNFLVQSTPAPIGDFITDFPDSTLHLVPSGPMPPNPVALLSSKALADFDRRAKRVFELVIYDTPPLSVAADASLISARAEGVVLVLDARKTRRPSALKAVDQLQRAKTTILGVVINRVPDAGDTSYRYYGSGKGNGRGELPDVEPAREVIEPLPAPPPIEYQPGA
ncbi:MAG: tyrosine-protein kinase [Solirubrobacteraceae bacterium]|nr:tyrosine-protein kinase [Solirubrobacteraceae bacterium]